MKLQHIIFRKGFNPITQYKDLLWDDPINVKMNFGILILENNERYSISDSLEKAILLMKGTVNIKWNSKNGTISKEKKISRKSVWEENPWCLHVPKDIDITLNSKQNGTELAIFTTPNDIIFSPKLYTPEECMSEERGKGTMRETSTRIVRTIFDATNSPDANLVLGEVINFPGKWSSYPPHYHPQPEIYHYKFLPEQGFGFGLLGDDAVKVEDRDTVAILNETHSQTSAPGYAMYYIWAIRHLEGQKYGPDTNTPIFEPQHLWVTKPENEDKIFPPKKK